MPVLNMDASNPITSTTTTAQVTENLYDNATLKTSTLFNKDQDLNTIIRYVDGSKWTIDYFLQVRNINTPATMPDLIKPPSVLSYNRIDKLDIYLTTPIEQTNPVDGISGSATINASFVPNIGDAFLTELLGGRQAIFVIDNIDKKMYSLHDIYDVQFKLFVFLDTDTAGWYNDFVLKTNKRYVYDRTFVETKSAPIILSSDYKEKLNYKNVKQDLINFFFLNFVNTEKNLISLPLDPTMDGVYVDTYLTDFVFKIVGYTDYPNSTNINRVSLDTPTIYTVYDMILNKDISKLLYLNKNMGFIEVPYTGSMPVSRNIAWLGITGLVGDKTNNVAIDLSTGVKINTLQQPNDYVAPINNNISNYVFSDSFYNNDTANAGIFEKVLLQYLNDEYVDDSNLNILLTQYRYWSTIEQFYLIPMLFAILQDRINNVYSAI